MNQNQPDKTENTIDKLIEYHLGLLSDDQAKQIENRIGADNDAQETSDKIKSSLEVLDQYTVDVPENLYQKIIFTARSQRISTEQIIEDLRQSTPAATSGIFGRLINFAATAAAILLITSAILLTSSHARHQARKAICAGNLGILGSALSSYANDFPNQLPFAKISSNGGWYDRNKHRPRRRHLFILIKRNYVDPKFFICPEQTRKFMRIKNLVNYDDFPAGMIVSYSFQNLYGDQKFTPKLRMLRWEKAQQTAIMADKTPLFVKDILIPELKPGNILSPNHFQIGGQNILILDGRVAWQKTSIFGPEDDNIWQAGMIRKYKGTETPANPTDCFLAP